MLASLFVGPGTIILSVQAPEARGETAILWSLVGIGVLYLGFAVVRIFTTPRDKVRLRHARDLGIGLVLVGGPLAVIKGLAPWTAAAGVWILPVLAFLVDRRFFLPFPGVIEEDEGPLLRTEFLHVIFDPDTEMLDGEVVRGELKGRRLSDLSPDEVDALMAEVSPDPESVNILRRIFPQFREGGPREGDGMKSGAGHRDRGRAGGDGRNRGHRPRTTMDVTEAYSVLDLEAGASDAEILKAHRRLMKLVHPDKGGSAYFASKLNEARDLLLDR